MNVNKIKVDRTREKLIEHMLQGAMEHEDELYRSNVPISLRDSLPRRIGGTLYYGFLFAIGSVLLKELGYSGTWVALLATLFPLLSCLSRVREETRFGEY